MGEEKKPSSLRTRVERKRKTYAKPMNPTPIIIGVVFVAICAAGLLFAFRGEPTPYPGQRTEDTSSPAPPPSTRPAAQPDTSAPLPKDPKQAVHMLADRAKRQAKKGDPAGATTKLQQALTQYPDYTPDIYHALAMVVDAKIQNAGGSRAPRELFREKLDFLLKAKAEIDAGKQWVYDPIGNRTGNLDMSIRQAEKEANK